MRQAIMLSVFTLLLGGYLGFFFAARRTTYMTIEIRQKNGDTESDQAPIHYGRYPHIVIDVRTGRVDLSTRGGVN